MKRDILRFSLHRPKEAYYMGTINGIKTLYNCLSSVIYVVVDTTLYMSVAVDIIVLY